MIKKNKIILNVIKRMKIGIKLIQVHYQDGFYGSIKTLIKLLKNILKDLI